MMSSCTDNEIICIYCEESKDPATNPYLKSINQRCNDCKAIFDNPSTPSSSPTCEDGRIAVAPLGYAMCPVCKGHGCHD